MRVEHDGRYAVVALLGGAARNPVSYRNLKEHPHVELQDGATKRDDTAREVDGDEKAIWWERAVPVWPDDARYQRNTSARSRCSCSSRSTSRSLSAAVGARGGPVLRLTAGDRAFSASPSCIQV